MSEPGTAAESPILDRIAALPTWLLISAALLLFSLLAAFPLCGDSCTFDEGTHAAAGWSYITRRDYRMSIDNPPLAKVLAALPLACMDLRAPSEAADWDKPLRYEYAFKWLYHCGNDPDRILRWSRGVNLLWCLILIPSVYAVARDLYGRRGGLIAIVLAAVCPTLIAHGHLTTPDAPVTTLSFLTVAAFWTFLRTPTLKWSLYSGILLGGAAATKHNALLLLPVLGALVLLQAVRTPRVERIRAVKPVAAGILGIGVIAWGLLWGVYGFRYAGSPDPAFQFDWDGTTQGEGGVGKAIAVARSARLLPEAHLYGLSLVVRNTSQGHDAFALGLHSQVGWWWYFPLTWLLKTPTCTILLILLAFGSMFRRPAQHPMNDLYLLVPVALFTVFLMTKNMNIGLRHALPILPFLWTLAGAVELPSSGRIGRWAPAGALALLAGCVLETVAAAPGHIAFFNAPSRLLSERHHLLVDSNLDWGQDLGRLKRYLDRRGAAGIKLAYFGAASPRQLGLKHEALPSFNVYRDLEPEWKDAVMAPGDLVAISATTLMGVYLGEHDVYRKVLDRLEPIEVVGDSIHVFRVRGR
jgi:4-amino-4-deoxy-L-arabinose transferase-like glycosyltransferase